MALGASPRDVQIGIVLRTLAMAELGLVLGMIGSRALASGLGSLLFGITTGDPVTFIEVGTLLIGVAAIAGYIPPGRHPGSIRWLHYGRIKRVD